MSAHDSRPPARPRRKLVLRKIGEGSSPALAMPTSNSYTGPLPAVRPPPAKTPLPIAPESRAAELRLAEVRPPEIWVEATEDAPEDAWAAAAMTPAAPSAVILPARMPGVAPMPEPAPMPASGSMPVARAATPGPSFPRVQSPDLAFAPTPASEPAARISVAPVVHTLPPVGLGLPQASVPTRRRFSADSKLLAGGGALAAAMLVLALGVMLGQRTAQLAPASAAASGPYPLVVETKAVAAAMPLPAAAEPPKAAMAAFEPVAAKVDTAFTIDVQALPTARRTPARPAPVHVAPLAAASSGWTVAGRPAPADTANPALLAQQAPTPSDATETVSNTASPSPQIPAAAPAVDPLVQAVREDIREDETRAK